MLTALLLALAWHAPPSPAGLAALELEVPANRGWVTDEADLLSDSEEAQLSALMESYRTGSGHEIALLTMPSLGDDSLESFTLRVAESWGIGDATKDEGALLFISRDDRRMRIEVGYGLEGTLPDAICARILGDVIAPEFRNGNWFGGIAAGIQAIHSAAGGDYGPIKTSSKGRRRSAGAFGVIPFLVFMGFFIFLSNRNRRHGVGGGGGSVLPWLLLSTLGNRGGGFGGGGGGGFGGFSGGGGFGGGGASGGW